MILTEPGAPIEYLYFPEDGVVSVVSVAENVPPTEVGIIGRDGLTGSAALLDADTTPHRTFVQITGSSALRIGASDLRHVVDSSASLRKTLLRYIQVFLVQVSSSAMSNGHGRMDERLARWLLMCHDRLDGDQIALTHEFMAMMISAQRTGVTETLHTLEGDGLIHASRGRVVVIDRAGLETRAGASYGTPEAEHRRLFGQRRKGGGRTPSEGTPESGGAMY